jgi:hypothetical protein
LIAEKLGAYEEARDEFFLYFKNASLQCFSAATAKYT